MKILNVTVIFIFILLQNILYSSCANFLETYSDDDLLELMRTESYVSVLFTKNNCDECDEYEKALYNAREELVDSLNSWVIKAVDSQLVRIYNPAKEHAIVFFRHGVPLLYDGEPDEDLIVHTFIDNKEPCVKELNDDNFEHLTQVSTGATTGDWFVQFYSTDCIDCQYLQARWEAVCSQVKRRLNIARINRQTTGRMTGRRFGVTKVPTFIFFRHGKMYEYSLNQYDISSLASFPADGYLKVKAEPVIAPKGMMEDSLLGVLDLVREYSFVIKFISTLIGIFIVLSAAYKMNNKKEKIKKSSQKKTKSK